MISLKNKVRKTWICSEWKCLHFVVLFESKAVKDGLAVPVSTSPCP